jgi:hypothetical protein
MAGGLQPGRRAGLAEYSIKYRVNPLNSPMAQRFIAQKNAVATEPVIPCCGSLLLAGE